MSQTLIEKANILRDSGKTNEAIKILKKFLTAKDYEIRINATISLGICYSNKGEYDKAIGLYKEAISDCENNKWLSRIGSIYRDMAIAQKSAKRYNEAEVSFERSLIMMEKYSDEGQGINASLGITYVKMGDLYFERKQYTKAEKAYSKGRKMLRNSHHEYWKLIAEVDYAEFLVAKKEFKKAQELLRKSVYEGIKQEKEYFIVKSLTLLGDIEKSQKNFDSAKMFYALAKIVVDKIFDSQEVRERFLKKIKL